MKPLQEFNYFTQYSKFKIFLNLDILALGKFEDTANRRTDHAVTKWLRTKGQTSIDKTLHAGRIQGGGAPGSRPPPKIGKKYDFFGLKSWIFTWNTPKISCVPPNIGKIWFFGVKSWFFTRNTPKIFAPPSARRNFFKCAPPPLTWNPGSAPA